MCPLRDWEGYEEFGYNVADRPLIRISYSRAAALHAVRSHLTRLHVWTDADHEIGAQFAAVCGQMHETLSRARSNTAAARQLQTALIDRFRAAKFSDREQAQLRNALLTALQQAHSAHRADPFQTIFRQVTAQARAFFEPDWPRNVTCVFETIGDPPYPNSRFWINALTDLHPDDPATGPTVHLRIKPEQLNIETYSAIYALFVHEAVCHVPADRTRYTNTSPFAEGFCDWAARHLFERWLASLDPLLKDAAGQFGRQIWIDMMTKGRGNRFWATRCFGHEAAEHVVDVFRGDGENHLVAVNAVITLARELVVLDEPLTRKDSLVRKLAGTFPEQRRDRLRRWREGTASARELLR